MPKEAKLTKEELEQQRIQTKQERSRKAAAEMARYMSWLRTALPLDPKNKEKTHQDGEKTEWEDTLETLMEENKKKFSGILEYKDDDELVEKYTENRIKLKRASEMCEYLLNLPENERKARGFSDDDMERVRDWKNEFDNLGVFLDCKMIVIQNKNYADPEKEKELKDLRKNFTELQQKARTADNKEDKRYYEAMERLRILKGKFGIGHQKENKVQYAFWKSKEKKAFGDKMTTKASAFTFDLASFGGAQTRNKIWSKKGEKGWSESSVSEGDRETTKSETIDSNKSGFKSPTLGIGNSYIVEGTLRAFQVKNDLKLKHYKMSNAFEVGKVVVTGRETMSLCDTEHYLPTLEKALGIEAAAMVVSTKHTIGGEDNNLLFEGKVEVARAEAEAKVGVGDIVVKGEDGQYRREIGFTASATAEAAVFKGSVKGGFSLFGVKVKLALSGTALSAGASAGVQYTSGRVETSLSGALGFGIGLKVMIDWSGLKDKITGWFERRRRRKEMRAQEAETAQNKEANSDIISEVTKEGNKVITEDSKKKIAETDQFRKELTEESKNANAEKGRSKEEVIKIKRKERVEKRNEGKRSMDDSMVGSKSGFRL